jgi:putative transposase
MTREERVSLIERTESELALSMQADLLSLSRASLYYQPRLASAEEIRLKHRIDEVYTKYPFYGARKIAVQLQREGMGINRKTVGRYMREMGIAAIYPGPNLSKRNYKEGVYPYLLRHITSAYPNHIWGIDITYIRMSRGWMYLVAILDWYSRGAGQLGTRSDSGTALCLGSLAAHGSVSLLVIQAACYVCRRFPHKMIR